MNADERRDLAIAVVNEIDRRADGLRGTLARARADLAAVDEALAEAQAALGMVIRPAVVRPLPGRR